jgi:hypothetical protein
VAPNNWSNVFFYAWDGDAMIHDTWPGVKVTADTLVRGVKFYYRTFAVPSDAYTFNLIFNQGTSGKQTVDVMGLNSDRYFEVTSTTNKYTVRDITDIMTGDIVVGDVTGDGLVDIADVNAVINIMLGKADSTDAADVNNDGNVDIADVNAVINIMLGKQ